MRSELLQKLQQIKDNPGFYRGLTPEEQAELFLFLFTPKKKIFEKPKVIQGIDGYNPVPDKDYLSKETSESLIAELAQKSRQELEKIIAERLSTIQSGRDGKDAVITPELIENIALMASELIVLPDFPTLITMEPEAIRNALELLPDGEKLAQEAIEGLPKRLEALENRPIASMNGGLTRGGVLQLIEENAAGIAETFETVSKNLDASDAVFSYTGENLTSIDYANGITKTFTYTGENLTEVTLSGATPNGINLTKTLSYTGENLSDITYS